MKYITAILFLLMITQLFPGPPESQWVTRSDIEVQTPGSVEALVPPGLHFEATPGSSQLDLLLLGPDGKPRNFELYWREKSGSCKIKLKAADIRLLKDFRFLWQSDIPDRIWMDRLEIRIDARDYVGKVRVEGFEDGEWRLLKEDAAVYKSAGRARVRVDFRPGFYEKIKLHFTSFNKKHQKRLIPIGSVTVPGTLTPGWAKDGEYKESYIEPTFKRRLSENIHELETLLPGSGLWVEALELETEARFQGQWKIGGLGILEGERVFRPLSSASVPFAKSGGKTVRFHIGKRWAGKSMLLKLDAGGKFLGKVTALKLIIRRPRFIFHADMPGTYRLLTGTGASQSVREWVGEAGETADFALEFKEPVANETWRPRSILDKYKIMGGPFNPEGFTWKAPVDVPKPGYYCFYLNRDASLETKPSGIRLVQSDTQVPFLFGPVKSVGVDLELVAQYDAKKNTTVYTAELPRASRHWSRLRLEAEGVFQRTVGFEKPGKGHKKWKTWRNVSWWNKDAEKAFLWTDMTGFPKDGKKIRFSIHHGDNQPMELKGLVVYYPSISVCFIAHEVGLYVLMGGNPGILPPSYDLSMIRSSLLQLMPEETVMGVVEPLEVKGKSPFADILNSNWGLYLIFGLVALVLIVVIVRLFPKPEK